MAATPGASRHPRGHPALLALALRRPWGAELSSPSPGRSHGGPRGPRSASVPPIVQSWRMRPNECGRRDEGLGYLSLLPLHGQPTPPCDSSAPREAWLLSAPTGLCSSPPPHLGGADIGAKGHGAGTPAGTGKEDWPEAGHQLSIGTPGPPGARYTLPLLHTAPPAPCPSCTLPLLRSTVEQGARV